MRSFLYWCEMIIAPLASVSLILVNPSFLSLLYFLSGALGWTFLEYAIHRFYLHDMKAKIHLRHHRRPDEKTYDIQWLFWLGAAWSLFIHPAFTAGLLFAYAYYLIIHHCSHHARDILSPRLLEHHDGHHRRFRFNYGVSTIFWDKLFGTKL